MKIQVTSEHIAKGQRHQVLRCPVALALTDALGETVAVESPYKYTRLHRESEKLPPEAGFFVMRFDLGLAKQFLNPFEFEIDA